MGCAAHSHAVPGIAMASGRSGPDARFQSTACDPRQQTHGFVLSLPPRKGLLMGWTGRAAERSPKLNSKHKEPSHEGKRYEDHLRDAGFQTEVIPNAGAGAAEAVRRILPRCHFDEKRCEAGLEALAWYHERLDDHREVGLGPLHDWSSHAADSFGLLAVSHEKPSRLARFNRRLLRDRGTI
jgi:hypothetical protein